ncbi:hypothetical protein BH11PAT2_BH11PAT2_06650 [soil metagenome]
MESYPIQLASKDLLLNKVAAYSLLFSFIISTSVTFAVIVFKTSSLPLS